ncbi:hypothetical protein L198_04799 [Cryptococcus wingfieldii CBS 7118]|uniref:Uncharacterized protein n=1 Tax=Cryptococcus wingfieldii CBS 7118 TaxID=1295528 RepID=A0A1E3J1F2_9TREE|nr:hypothetical protein L198_04799 [Cryptococcus wingfieldii CBS 7118]ODN94658.1 hypothetical protein L198_04799 [Cryptococcus wingfieldii CBS 7118]
MSRLCLEKGKTIPGGSIVLTASVGGLKANAGPIPYFAAKASVISMAQTSAFALKGTNIRVNAICPEFIDASLPIFFYDEPILSQDLNLEIVAIALYRQAFPEISTMSELRQTVQRTARHCRDQGLGMLQISSKDDILPEPFLIDSSSTPGDQQHASAFSYRVASEQLVSLGLRAGYLGPITAYCFRYNFANVIGGAADDSSLATSFGHTVYSSARLRHYTANMPLYDPVLPRSSDRILLPIQFWECY